MLERSPIARYASTPKGALLTQGGGAIGVRDAQAYHIPPAASCPLRLYDANCKALIDPS